MGVGIHILNKKIYFWKLSVCGVDYSIARIVFVVVHDINRYSNWRWNWKHIRTKSRILFGTPKFGFPDGNV
jgi:hypothetical protein